MRVEGVERVDPVVLEALRRTTLSGYEIAHVDELDVMPVNGGEFVWRPVRRRFGISAFGSNAYSAEKAGQRVIEEHSERDGHEEMYVVLRGRATFTLGDDELDAPARARSSSCGRARGAARSPRRTTRSMLAVGAKPGVVFEPSPWEDVFAAYSYAEQGELERGARARAGGDRRARPTRGRATTTRRASRRASAIPTRRSRI